VNLQWVVPRDRISDATHSTLVVRRGAMTMSQEDYKSGMQGVPWHPGMDRTDYDAGKSVHDQRQALAGPAAPKTAVDGVGFTMLLMAPILAVMYPAVGAFAAAGATTGALIVLAIEPSAQMGTLFAMLIGGIATATVGIKVERALSRYRLYRIVRHIVRLLLIGSLVAQMLMTGFNNTWSTSPIDAFNKSSGGSIFAAIVSVFVLHWLFRRFDRVFFPARDSYAISQERKYAGLSDDEIFAIKNAKFRGMRAFALTWIAATAALAFAVPGSPVALWLAVVFVVLWLLRGRLFFKLHRQRLAQAEAARAASRDRQSAD
jgi:hypothetical protein